SGYDIACARSVSPIVYETTEDKPSFRHADFHPTFHRHLYFVYLNRKQNSKESIRKADLATLSSGDISKVSELTLGLEKTDNLEEFQQLMDHHEAITGKTIHQKPVRELHFNDFAGTVKSLGAWGGDFILAASSSPEEYVRNYFNNKNLTTIFNYGEIVLGKEFKSHGTTT
ncbi:MAG TPA: hypothetical protein VN249_07860, partial [Prolixibacteraceae bacterium]|nr:hypothetical protein [Prolixibacteraceae bacterium]